MHARMYVCAYVYTYIRVFACIYVCVYVIVCVCTYVCMYVCMYVYMHVYAHMYVCTYVCIIYACACTYVCMYVYMHVYAHMYVCMYICMCMHICTYVCMYACVCTYVCMYVCIYACGGQFLSELYKSQSAPPRGDPWAAIFSWLKLTVQAFLEYFGPCTGCRMMASLRSNQECSTSPAEDLHPSQDDTSLGALRANTVRRVSVWVLASWNVRTLLDAEGPIEVARQGSELVDVLDGRKVDQVVDVLGSYRVDVARLQETKWFGEGVYKVGNSVVLASGRAVPGEGVVRQRGEGVALVLSGPAVVAWKAGGSRWKAWSSRLVTVTLKVGKRRCDWLHVFSCYAPTYAASREDKEEFFDTLQQAVSGVPSQECYMMLGDFNARVGSRGSGDEWLNERGPFGLGELNDAGKEFLSFLSTNEATVCNTWFPKKDIYKQTWQHPKSKQWHCIDFAVMRRADLRKCRDVVVKRGAECNSDHRMLKVEVEIGRKFFTSAGRRSKAKKFDVSGLQRRCEDDARGETTFDVYVSDVCSRVKEEWSSADPVEEKWNVLKTALCDAASSHLGYAG